MSGNRQNSPVMARKVFLVSGSQRKLKKPGKITKKRLTHTEQYNIIKQYDEVRKYLTKAPVKTFYYRN